MQIVQKWDKATFWLNQLHSGEPVESMVWVDPFEFKRVLCYKILLDSQMLLLAEILLNSPKNFKKELKKKHKLEIF